MAGRVDGGMRRVGVQVRGVEQDRIDHEGQAPVVGTDHKGHVAGFGEAITRVNAPALASVFLVGVRWALANDAVADVDQQVARAIDLDADRRRRASESHRDTRRIRAAADDEVVSS